MNRVINNWATTIIGVIAIIGAIYMFLTPEFTTTEASELAGIGFIFLRSKDSLIGLSPKEPKDE